MARIPQALLWAALAACSLKASASAGRRDAVDTPSAADFQMAMDRAFARQTSDIPDLLDGDCAMVTKLQCSPAGHGRSQCTYVYQGGKRGTAILDRAPDRSWRWVSGPYHCAVVVISN